MAFAASAPAATNEITTFKALAEFRSGGAAGNPARFTGTVLCFDSDWSQLFIQDSTGTRYFNPKELPSTAGLQAGARVEITGKAIFLQGYVSLTNLAIKVIKQEYLPTAAKSTLTQLTNNLGLWVETAGRARIADTSLGRLALVISDQGQSALIYVMGSLSPELDAKRFVGCEVKVKGVNTSRVVKGRLEPASLVSPGIDCVTITAPRENDPWQSPVVSIDSVLSRELGDWTNEAVHINGVIAAIRPNNRLEIKDPTGSIEAHVLQVGGVKLNGRVDVWGFLAVLPEGAVLRDAFFERVQPGPARRTPSPESGSSGKVEDPLTTVSEIVKLGVANAAHRAVRLRGVITYADPEWGSIFFQDHTGAIYADCSQRDVRAGQWVELEGVSDPGGFAPQLINVKVTVLGATNFPTAVDSDLEDLASGRLDAHWVQMQGIVRRVTLEWSHLTLALMTPRGRFKVIVPGYQGDTAPSEFVDALVKVQGACGAELNAGNQLSGIVLHTPSTNRIEIVEPVPADPFSARATPIASVATFSPQRLTGRRIRIHGTATLVNQGDLFVQDDTGGIRVAPQTEVSVAAGDVIDVLGFPAVGDFAPYLEEAVLRVVSKGKVPVPRWVTAEAILRQGTNDGRLMQIDAQLLQPIALSARPKLVLQDGPIIFTAVVRQALEKKFAEIGPSSILRVSGVTVLQGGEGRDPSSFRLLVLRPEDIQVLRKASWWTVRHTAAIATTLTLAVVLSLLWAGSLRSQVRRQTEEVRQKLAERNEFAASLEREKAQLASTHRKLMEASRQAGMAEVATAVLHNVGNVLNSVNVSTGLMSDQVSTSRLSLLGKATGLIEKHKDDLPQFLSTDPKGKQLPAFLSSLNGHLLAEQKALLAEINLLTKNVDHVKHIVAMQQEYARCPGLIECHHVEELIEYALGMNAGALEGAEVKVHREIEVGVPDVYVDKHKVLQILVNLLRNARYACDASGAEDKRITVRAFNGGGAVKISVIDNGIGIPPENLTRIFNHGFTTRKDGHGFGLHSGALAANEMGGRLSAQSEGAGRGAAFTLEIPVRKRN
jgi:signal transduction histidine kinase